jgi:uncharacterized protein (UPF0276 family)
MVAFPDIAPRTGLGVGLDLPWGPAPGAPGFERDARDGDRVTPSVPAYFRATAGTFQSAFVSWQPKSRSRLRLDDYAPSWDRLFSDTPTPPRRALHHTMLNMGALEPYEREEICRFTNALCRRYDLAWVNEDLGLWSLNGRPLPYPLPPFLTEDGLARAVANVREVSARLEVPLLVEFPGFSEGTSIYVGRLDAYDFFARLAEAAEVAVTLDLGHLLSWRWIRGHRGEALYAELERLPLAHCAEIHLSGCALEGDAFFDYHHGVLLDEQLVLLERLLPLCPELRVVTYEDPRFSDDGSLVAEARPGFSRLRALVEAWAAGAAAPPRRQAAKEAA